MLPLYEAKMLHLYDTRWATYEPDGSTRLMTENEKAERLNPMPRYWVSEEEVDKKLEGRWDKPWFLGWRDICRATDVRTVISTKLPRVAVGNKVPVMMPAVTSDAASVLQACLSSLICDYAARQKLGGTTMNYFVLMQVPVLTLEMAAGVTTWFDRPVTAWMVRRADRLNGWVPDSQERAELRAEIDAAMMHLYSMSRAEVAHVMDSFPILHREDVAGHGSYRTRDLVLAAYDAMADAKESGTPYRAPWEDRT